MGSPASFTPLQMLTLDGFVWQLQPRAKVGIVHFGFGARHSDGDAVLVLSPRGARPQQRRQQRR
jgi:hypothetical protein